MTITHLVVQSAWLVTAALQLLQCCSVTISLAISDLSCSCDQVIFITLSQAESVIIIYNNIILSIGHIRLRCRGGHAMSAAASGAPLLSVSSQMSRHQLRLFVPSLLQQCGHRHSQILTRYSGLSCMEEH